MPGQTLMGLQGNISLSVCGDLTIQNRVCVCACVCVCVCVCVCGCSVAQSFLSLHALFQARILEQVAISFSRGSSLPRDRTSLLCLMHWLADSLLLSHLQNRKIEHRSQMCIFSPASHCCSLEVCSFQVWGLRVLLLQLNSLAHQLLPHSALFQ